MATSKPDIVVANRSFVANVDGRKVFVRGGKTRVRSDDPLVAGRDRLFDPVDDDLVETARSEPGSKRSTKRTKTSEKTTGEVDS